MSSIQEHVFQVRWSAQVSSQWLLELGSEPGLPGANACAFPGPLKRERNAWCGWRLLPWRFPHFEVV